MPSLSPADAHVLRTSDLLRDLPDAELAAVLAAAAHERFAPGSVLIRQGAPARRQHLVLAGRLRVEQIAADGHAVLLRFAGPGDTVGGFAALGDLVYTGSARADEPARTLAWSSAAFARLLSICPRLAANTMRLMADRIRELQDRCAELATQRVDRRVAHALLRASPQSPPGADRPAILRLTRSDLADLTGTTLFTVSRLLSRWAREGIVETGRQRVVIRDPKRLTAIAEDALA